MSSFRFSYFLNIRSTLKYNNFLPKFNIRESLLFLKKSSNSLIFLGEKKIKFLGIFSFGKPWDFSIGLFLFIIPYLLMILSNYLIRKDDKLVKSADRIR